MHITGEFSRVPKISTKLETRSIRAPLIFFVEQDFEIGSLIGYTICVITLFTVDWTELLITVLS